MRENNNEEQTKAPENVTGNPAPTTISGGGASWLFCAATERSDTTKTMMKNTPLQMPTCAISHKTLTDKEILCCRRL